MRSTLQLGFAGIVVITAIANAGASTTWEYIGVVDSAPQNDIGFPVPLGAPVSIQLTFDPVTPDTNSFPGAADYLMSGGDTTLQVKIGSHVSTPVANFRITVFTQGCCAADDQLNFLSFESQGDLIDIDFPGYLEGAETQLFLRRRHTPGPIVSEALPTVRPNPADFFDARLVFFKNRTDSDNRLVFAASLGSVPEPTAFILGALSAVSVAAIGRRSRRIGSSQI
jgi:hypothetical protein